MSDSSRTSLASMTGSIGRWTRARSRTGRGRVALAALAVLVLAVPSVLGLTLAASLGAGDDAGGGAGARAATGVTRVATLGVMAPLSGDLSTDGVSARNAVALAVDEANKSGAVPGWRIELSAHDDLSRPDGGAQAVDAFVANNHVIGVVGPLSSLVAKVSLPTLSAAGIPVVSPSNADPTLTDSGSRPRTRPFPSYFRLAGTDERQARVAAEYAVRTLGRRRIVVVDGEPRYGTTLGARFAARAAALGASVTSVYQVRGDEADGSEIADTARAIEEDAPDLVYVSTGAAFAGKLRARLADAGTSIQVVGSDALLQPRYTDEARSAADGDLIIGPLVPPTRLPSSGAFVADYSDRFGGPADDEGSTRPGASGGVESPGASGRSSGTLGPRGQEDPADLRSQEDPAETASPGRGATTTPRVVHGTSAPVSAPGPGLEEGPHGPPAAGTRGTSGVNDPAAELELRRAEAIPAVAAYAYDAARAIIRAAATVLPGRTTVDAATRHDLVTAIGSGSFAGITGSVAFDR
ncbi:ABC transporter substrate-binding protein, partial [Frankia casuarinae]